MNDRELLADAIRHLHDGEHKLDATDVSSSALMSIAASLLIIATHRSIK